MDLSALLFTMNDDLAPVEKRLKNESFEAVGESLPQNYAKEVGWFTADQIAGSQYAVAASLPAGGTARMKADYGFVHVDEIRPQMTCDRAIAAYPRDPWPRLMRAALEAQTRNYADATADYRAATTVPDPKWAQSAYYGLASVYYAQHKYKVALSNVNDAILSGSGEVYTLRAFIEEAMGDDDLATADAQQGYNQYNGPGRDTSPATYALATAYSDLGYFAASNEQADKVLKHHPASAENLLLRAFNEYSSGDLKNARADFNSASVSNPRMEQPYLGLAMLSFATGNTAAAIANARRAYAMYPQDDYAAIWTLITNPHAKVKTRPSDAWPGLVLCLFLNRWSIESLDAAASSADPFTQRMQLCEAHFYGGVYLLHHGDKSRAHSLLQSAAKDCPYRQYERTTAIQLFHRL